EVLEEAQHPEVRDDAQPEEPATPAGPLFHAARGAVIDRRRDGDQDEEPGMDVSVEDVARDEQEHVLAALRQQPVRRWYDDEEDDEVETMENHSFKTQDHPRPKTRDPLHSKSGRRRSTKISV